MLTPQGAAGLLAIIAELSKFNLIAMFFFMAIVIVFSGLFFADMINHFCNTRLPSLFEMSKKAKRFTRTISIIMVVIYAILLIVFPSNASFWHIFGVFSGAFVFGVLGVGGIAIISIPVIKLVQFIKKKLSNSKLSNS